MPARSLESWPELAIHQHHLARKARLTRPSDVLECDLRFGLEVDLFGHPGLAPTRVVLGQSFVKYSRQATGKLAASLPIDSETATWQFACLPSCPQY
jgi:hypothetical protein